MGVASGMPCDADPLTGLLAISALLPMAMMSAHASFISWDGEYDGDALTGPNWSGDVTPAAADTASIDNGALADQPRLRAGDAWNVNQVTVAAGRLTIAGDLASSSGVSVGGGGQLSIESGGSVTGGVSSAGWLSLQGFVDALNLLGSSRTVLGAGSAYAQRAVLDGVLQVQGLNALDYSQDSLVLGLLLSDDLSGSFSALDLRGLDSGFSASTRVVEAGGQRRALELVLTRRDNNAVPLPGSVALAALGLALLAATRRHVG